MDCEHAQNLIAMNMAGELPSDDRARLDEHLNGCTSCRATSQAWLQQDVDLRRAFAPRRAAATAVAERVITQVRTLPVPGRRRVQITWIMMPLMSAAAGFLLAVLVLPPWLKTTEFVEQQIRPEKPAVKSVQPAPEAIAPASETQAPTPEAKAASPDMPAPERAEKDSRENRDKAAAKDDAMPKVGKSLSEKEPPRESARKSEKEVAAKKPAADRKVEDQKVAEERAQVELKLATGPVEMASEETKGWQEVEVGRKLSLGCSVRTPPKVRCDFRCPDGSEIRLNGDTEVFFHSERNVELKRGELWSNIPATKEPKEPLQVRTGGATIRSTNGEFDVRADARESHLRVLQGKAEVVETNLKKKSEPFEVLHGQEAQIVNGEASRVKQRTVAELEKETMWATDAYGRRRAEDLQNEQRVRELLAQMSDVKSRDTKFQATCEVQLRGMGDSCATPLTRIMQDRPQANPEERRTAARLLADLAPSWAVPELIEFLKDADPDVRFYAATGLRRLTGQTLGMAPEELRSSSAKTMKLTPDDTYKAWKRW